MNKGKDAFLEERGRKRLQLAAIGLESEFALVVDDRPVRPEDLFASPRTFIRAELMHRRGSSYHLPTGGAVYFDTGVIEIATPVIEIDRGCAARAGRSLWEGIRFVRDELTAWEQSAGRHARLAGFSAHYNISFEIPRWKQGKRRTIHKLALLLAYILPAPVMLLATNKRSTGVGVRPRGDRIEVTADFTPDAALMIATATLITGVVREVMTWPSFELEELERHDIPVIASYAPIPHTTRHGWLARFSCYPENPFTCDVNAAIWRTRDGDAVSLRHVAERITRRFRQSIRRLSDPFTFRLIESVMQGRTPSLLDLDERPPAYEDVGRLCKWDEGLPPAHLSRSRYERVLIRAISGERLRLHGRWYRPIGMRGWSQVAFRPDGEGRRQYFSIDALLNHLGARNSPSTGARKPTAASARMKR